MNNQICKSPSYLNSQSLFLLFSYKALDDDEKAKLNLGFRGGASNIIFESGLYFLILRSRKPVAKAFKR